MAFEVLYQPQSCSKQLTNQTVQGLGDSDAIFEAIVQEYDGMSNVQMQGR